MSTKRTSPESSIDKQTNEDSDSFEQDENAKRAKLTSQSDTMLPDLPMELIESILIKAVAMEVMDMTRKKSLWKRAAEPVINRLTTVCLQWTSILTTKYFRNELHRIFDAEKAIRLEIVQKYRFTDHVYEAITFKDELFVIYKPGYYDTNKRYPIRVYDRNDATKVKDVIPLPRVEPQDMAVCNVSNCLYILNNKPWHLSVLRLTKTDEHQYKISTMIGLLRRNDTMAVAANGNLVLSWQRRQEQRALITVYNPNGQLLNETWLSSDVYNPFSKVIPKSNGNFVLVSRNYQSWDRPTKLIEIDMHGSSILRQYQSSLRASGAVCQADKHGRISIVEQFSGIELLDSELHLLEYTGLRPDEDHTNYGDKMHYNAERNEVVAVVNWYSVTIFRFTEE